MVNMLQRSTLVLFMMLLCVLSGGGAANASDTSVAGAYDLSEYSNHEVLVVYEDGSHEVLSYASQTELAAGLQALAAADEVDFFQPNFAYTAAGSLSNDEFF